MEAAASVKLLSSQIQDERNKKRNLRWLLQITFNNKKKTTKNNNKAMGLHLYCQIGRIKTFHLQNINPLPKPLTSNHARRSGPVSDAFPAQDVFVVRVWKGGDNLGERDKKCHLFCGTLEPISRADQPPILPDTSSSSLITIRLFIIFTKNKD